MCITQIQIWAEIIASFATFGGFIMLFRRDKEKLNQIAELSNIVSRLETSNSLLKTQVDEILDARKRLQNISIPNLEIIYFAYSSSPVFEIRNHRNIPFTIVTPISDFSNLDLFFDFKSNDIKKYSTSNYPYFIRSKKGYFDNSNDNRFSFHIIDNNGFTHVVEVKFDKINCTTSIFPLNR